VSTACPDPNRIAELAQGLAPGDDRAALEEHVAHCVDCRQLLTALAHSSLARVAPAREALGRGAGVGRYVILNLIGSGTMGAVYSAYDPELDRKVALKVLHVDSGQDRLVAEARAMARLSHPNVVPVLDLGAEQGRVYLAMEFVEGITLDQWLQKRRRSPRAIVRALIEAGRGLAAAHAAGLAHRDFKPENVLVGIGRDKRVRVTDFGLARIAQAEAGTPELDGTPAYMAPEQFRKLRAGPAADQFSFCVVLWEALFLQAPFDPGNPPTIDRLADEVLAGRVRSPPPRHSVPAWLRRVLVRGLQPNPDDRFPSLEALLEALGRDPASGPRRFAVASLALLLAAVSAGAYRVLSDRRPLCQGAEQRLAGIWDGPTREKVRAALLATRLPYAQFTWNSIERTLEDYSRDWVAMQTDACEATRVRGEQSQEVLDLRTGCLSQRLSELKASTEFFENGGDDGVERAIQVAAGLSSLSGCADLEALKAPLRSPAAAANRLEVDAVRAELATAKVLERSGRSAQGLPLAQRAVDRAQASGYLPLEAEALAQLGSLQRLSRTDNAAAEASLEEAFYTAQRARHDAVAARSAAQLVAWVGEDLHRSAEAERWARVATAVLDRTGGDPEAQALLDESLGDLFTRAGKAEEALAEYRKALALDEKVLGAEHPTIARLQNQIGDALGRIGRFEEAIAANRRALAICEKAFGPNHPDTASAHDHLGGCLFEQGRTVEAVAEHRRALSIREQALGPEHPLVAMSHSNLSRAIGSGGHEESIAEARRAIEIWEKHQGFEADVANCHANLGAILHDQGKDQDAAAELRRASQILKTLSGPEHPRIAIILENLGLRLVELKEYDAALECLLRAITILEAGAPTPVRLAGCRYAVALAMWGLNKDRARAASLARTAREELAPIHGQEGKVAEIDAWLASHRGGKERHP
jgi:tetratricopeptide (TPR) repeat protein/predicted Ser/Thr protein kinase